MAAKMKDLGSRIVFSLIAVVVLTCMLIFLNRTWMGPIVGVGVAVVTSMALAEYYQLARKRGVGPPLFLGIVLALIYILFRYLHAQLYLEAGFWDEIATRGTLMVMVLILFIRHFWAREQAIASLAISVFGIFYIVFPLSLLLDILYGLPFRFGVSGPWWFLFIILVTVVTDMGAYFVGHAFGRHRLSPSLSPGKTVEGAIGGVVCGTLAAFAMGFWGHQLPLLPTVILGFLCTIVGQVGDIGESLLKRDAGVKDSSQIPGVGGMLDVVDSLLFTIPLVYIGLNVLNGQAP